MCGWLTMPPSPLSPQLKRQVKAAVAITDRQIRPVMKRIGMNAGLRLWDWQPSFVPRSPSFLYVRQGSETRILADFVGKGKKATRGAAASHAIVSIGTPGLAPSLASPRHSDGCKRHDSGPVWKANTPGR